MKKDKAKYVFYLAVIPFYRRDCFEDLKNQFGEGLELYAGEAHLDPTVRTGLPASMVRRVRNRRLVGRRLLLQTGSLRAAIGASVTVVDLNPRNLTSWALVLLRRGMGRRTLVWGHLHPRAGRDAMTAKVRIAMRRIANGTILYSYSSSEAAKDDLPGSPVWVAPNALYRAEDIYPVSGIADSLIYVGRLEHDKNAEILVEAFAISGLASLGKRLIIAGYGSVEHDLRNDAKRLGIENSISFVGRVDTMEGLQDIYRRSFLALSPGYVGLGLTQSLGFGVPMVAPRDAPHSPEVELEETGGLKYFEPADAHGLGLAMKNFYQQRSEESHDPERLSSHVRALYSAESMANGLKCALLDQDLVQSGASAQNQRSKGAK